MAKALNELVEFLAQQATLVHDLEKEGEALLAEKGQRAFQVKLEEKAEILAALGEKAWPLTEAVDGELGKDIARKLEQFSMSASTALRIGSVFFMTALLYPEDHISGGPNDLDILVRELKEKL
ncbi:hypothetical protein [Pseudodesulfovibrio piezophilus]|uniref:Uncharacterized protein n=1 Tax=Pseudodesulfovibrio piezophilus (strain DSM 21447 / JCM 15486 / C1TLV30) TaxID=1322246 RepID=M1WPX1_PSEP2|nr:hypothetical protein [Pseudodesulfovibrio piezophilus]CCH47332.1 conserved protein of unknown function [Pseudodesulfovibrio piezophilus C1TLV30]